MKFTTTLFLLLTVLTLFNCQKDSLDETAKTNSSDQYFPTSVDVSKLPTSKVNGCNQMISNEVAQSRAVGLQDWKWENGKVLKVKFIDRNTSFMRNAVKVIAAEWTKEANVSFEFVENGSADIKIVFDTNNASGMYWSKIGRTAADTTMNLGDLNENDSEEERYRVILHEFGHALGLKHEHQHPGCSIIWNKPLAMEYYTRRGLNEEQVERSVFQNLDIEGTERTQYDQTSIMHYGVPAEITRNDIEVGENTRLSTNDIRLINKMYPFPDQDGDGANQNVDCDDNNPAIHPEAFDIANNGIDENCSGDDRSVLYQISSGGTSDWTKLNRNVSIAAKKKFLVVGDFDGNNQDDLVKASKSACELYRGGGGATEDFSATVRELGKDLQVGDFNGDGKDDLFYFDGSILWVSYHGGSYAFLNIISSPSVTLKVGDFNGDGKSDVVAITSNSVSFYSGGKGDPIVSNLNNTYSDFGFLVGDFNGDGKDDLFNANGKKWRVLYAGQGAWKGLRDQATTTDKLQVGHFDGIDADGANTADIFLANGTKWKYYAGGVKVKILQDNKEVDDLILGDFNGDNLTDVVRIREIGE